MMAKWIEREAGRRPSPGPRPSPRRDLDELLSEALDARKAKAAPMPKRPWLARTPRDYPPAGECTLGGELRRLAKAAGPIRWHSPLRARLIGDGLIEVVLAEDGLWLGDRLTSKGAKRIR